MVLTAADDRERPSRVRVGASREAWSAEGVMKAVEVGYRIAYLSRQRLVLPHGLPEATVGVRWGR